MTDDSVTTPGDVPDRETIDQLLGEVMACPDSDRAAALDAACAAWPDLEPQLRQEYGVARTIKWSQAVDESVPDLIGPYRVLEVRGEGGMGTVYVAEETSPVRRMVAIKVIKLGMDCREVIARFDLERRALAAMNHRCIAKVLAADATDRGQPYFVMELVEGLPLTHYCDKHKLDVPSRIEVFREVCAGVQHAHQKGIIHRDLKPGNILVVLEDDRPVPKILDFGLAKATNKELLSKTLFTERDRILGTPEYMAPEQARMDDEATDTRADIYSLGVVLYELLSGFLPFSPDELRGQGWSELQRILTEQDPQKPSARLRVTGPGAETAAGRRRTSYPALMRCLRGDLDWIVLKALAKEPERRYDTATALSTDLKRYLDHEPVAAGPPSASYRISKLLRRYRGQFAAAALVLVSLVAGLAGVLFYANEAAANAATAREVADRLQEKVDEFNLLSGVVGLERAQSEESETYPAWPERLPQLRRFVERYADPLRNARAKLVEAVAKIRRRASEWTSEQQVRDRETHPDRPRAEKLRQRRGQLRRLQAILKGKSPEEALKSMQNFALIESDTALARFTAETLTARLAELETEIDVLNRRIESRRSYDFSDEQDSFLHETMTQLIADIDAFEQSVAAGVRGRLSWAERIEDLSVETHTDRWKEAREGIPRSAAYLEVGVDLEPQIGLVPIGKNPKSKLWEFYHLRSAANPTVIPSFGPDGSLEVTAATGIVFVLIPGGKFTMGSQSANRDRPNYDPHAPAGETHVHEAEVQPFFLARYETTQSQWKRLAHGDDPSMMKAGWLGDRQQLFEINPVEQVSWQRCVSLLKEHGLLLPTETQWEYACRAGTTTPWSTGADRASLDGFANVSDATAKTTGLESTTEAWSDGFTVHAPVGSFQPNAFGLFDMHGNVSEWCLDSAMGYASPGRPADGLRRATGDAGTIIQRGGNFMKTAIDARSAARKGDKPDRGWPFVGVRVARAIAR